METLMSYCNGGKQEMVQNLVQEPAQVSEQLVLSEAPEESAQNLKQDAVQNGEQANEQGMQNPASEVFVQNEAQDMKQNLKQDGAPETAQDVKQDGEQAETQAVKQNTKKDGASASVKAGGIVVNLPGAKERPILTTVSMRLSPEIKARLQAMARRRHMSLGEFCGSIMADVAQIAEDESEAA